MSDKSFHQRLERLHHDITQQGSRVESIVTSAFESIFSCNRTQAEAVQKADDIIDRVDIEIERSAVDLLTECTPDHKSIRLVLTIVKVNNELERIADLSVDIAEQVVLLSELKEDLPQTMRVLVNSIIGMIRDADQALRDLDAPLAQIVLSSDNLVEEFKTTLLDEVHLHLAEGKCSAHFASSMWRICNALGRIGDHVSNVCEQIIYVDTGQIVRHSATGWSNPMDIT